MWVDFVVCGAHFFLILHVYSSINIIIKNLPALVLKSTTTKSTVQKSFKISLLFIYEHKYLIYISVLKCRKKIIQWNNLGVIDWLTKIELISFYIN